jgi:signal transduction histidine kinase
MLDDLGLVVALKGLARRTREHAAVDVTVHAEAGIGPVSDAAAAMLYRVAEEAVANAVHHGWAEHVAIGLAGTAAGIEFTVGDDGRGFDIDAARTEPGIGLFMMQERASLAGGTFSIRSCATTGTTITVFLPLKQGWSS